MYYKISGHKLLKRFLKLRYFAAVICVIIVLSVTVSVYGSLVSDKVIPQTKVAAEKLIAAAVNNAFDSFMKDFATSEVEFLSPVYDSSGSVTGYMINAEAVASAEAEISSEILRELKQKETVTVKIPSGSLTDVEFFSGKGIPVAFKSHLTSSVVTNTESSVESVGINHTLYTAKLNISVNLELLISGKSEEFTMDFSKVLAERIIIGEVPLS